ncbi:MAG: prepilin-type N-terminal cleavage/methylation domain-containing protein [Candidatus Eisenbacteria bacterium]
MKNQRGFTLVELAVALLIFAAVATVSYRMLIGTREAYTTQRDLVETQQNARLAMQTITSDLRQISFGKDATQPSVVYAGIDSIVFVADLFDTIPGAEVVSIHLTPTLDSGTVNPSDRIIARTVWDTTGGEVLTGPVAYGVADSGLTFLYFDRDGDPMAFPIVQPEHISEVEVAVTAQTAHSRDAVGYQDVTITSIVYPRNLPFTPPMPRPNPPGCGGLTSPNCESLTMSWTTPTQNTDGSELQFNDISHFSVYYGATTDSMNLDTRLARNMNEWTVKDLVGGQSYYIAVTATSVAGVESFPCRRNGAVGAAAAPKAPESPSVGGGVGAVGLTWRSVTEDTLDNQITAEVTYTVYRGASSGFALDGGSQLAAGLYDTTYTDFVSDSCVTFFYRVTAEACGIEGEGSAETSISLPPKPSCPPVVYAQEGSSSGEIVVLWTAPTTRVDGSPLPPSQISGHRVYYSLVPGAYTDSVEVGVIAFRVISGLQDCSTYYVNVATIDDCGVRGMLCPGQEGAARTSAPCNEYVPEEVDWISLSPGDRNLELTWAANRVDCDLDGYRVYYGDMPGVYNGTTATEGPSPVFINAAAAHLDSSTGRFTLHGLEPCTQYYVNVTAVDVCTPPLESAWGPEQTDMTICGSCDLAKACVTEIAEGGSQERIRYQIGNEGGTNVTVESMEIEWGGGTGLREIVYDGVTVWDYTGAHGEDPTGVQYSPVVIDVDDFGVGSDEDFGDPREMELVFDGTATGDMVDVSFDTNEGLCTITLSPCGVLFEEDFTQSNGAPQGWTPRTGSNWRVVGNTLRTTSDGRITPDAFGFSHGDYTASVRTKAGGSSAYRRGGIYVRYNDTGNYYLLRYYPYFDRLELLRKVNNGALVTLASTSQFNISDDTWYDLQIAAYLNTFRVWFDGQLVDWDGSTGTVVTDNAISTGNIAMYGWSMGNAYFDDVRVEPTCGCGGSIP